MSNSPQDGGPGSSTPAGEYITRPGAANQDGTNFEIKMCALVFLRAVQSNSSFTNFKMTSNDERAGGFDDIVFSYGSPDNEQNILVQLKTSEHPISLTGKKSLKNYFESLEKSNTSAHFKNCTYAFFTNANVELTNRVECLDSPAKNLLCTTWKPEDVFKVNITDNICKDFKNETGAKDFVDRLLIFRYQFGPKDVDEIIKQELIKMCNGFVFQCHVIQKNFVEKIAAWWEKKKKTALDDKWEEWTELQNELLGQNTLLKEIQFREDVLSDLENRVLGSEYDIILFKCESNEAQIACLKVYQTFIKKEKLPVIFTDISEPQRSQDTLFSLWSNGVCDVLVVTDVTNCYQNLGENIVRYINNPQKRNKEKLVIISSRDAKTLGISQDFLDEIGTEIIKSSLNQLDHKSQARLKDLPVDFQGKTIALGSISVEKVLEGGILQDVLSSTKVKIGEAMPESTGIYIPRTLSKKFLVNVEVLLSDDNFFLCDMNTQVLKLLLAKAKGVENIDERWFSENEHRFNVKSSQEFEAAISGFKCCAEYPSEDPLHFLKATGIACTLQWVHSHGNTENVHRNLEGGALVKRDFLTFTECGRFWRSEEEDLVSKRFGTVIVAGEPGSGKTALLRELARKRKEIYPHRWTIYIDLNKHSATLEMMKRTSVNSTNVLDLLSKPANLDGCELGKKLLNYNLLEEGDDLCILFDAFDEIEPSHIDTVIDILTFIRRNLRRSTLCVASRYNVKGKLEMELRSKAFDIEPLSDQEQFNFVSKLWDDEKVKKFQRTVLDKIPVCDGVRLSSFPLLLKMMCEVCDDRVLSDESMLLNIANLYDTFIEMKLDIYLKNKLPLHGPSSQIDIMKGELRKTFMERHMICSLVALDIVDNLDETFQSEIIEKVQEICQDIEEGREYLGIMDCVVDGKPHFLHRSFAEHFAGKWLAKHWKGNEPLIRLSVSASWLEIVYKTFSQELARELPAHLAVLNGDINALENVKDHLNETDALGRTPLHLAVLNRDRGAKEVLLELLRYKPNLKVTDRLFGLTPLRCAAEAECWELVEILRDFGTP
ncbi:uncharacterized protein [Anabrus simplex]|uniref:uncharacterized protein n=1 Tax=Anabrus simplex TaxID=316456 RepID=UPI0035A36168